MTYGKMRIRNPDGGWIEIDGGAEVPTKLSELTSDAAHRTVTDSEKAAWDGKLDADELPEAVNDALAQAKASGEFDGRDGQDGQPGTDGKDGKTPVKGVDYFTSADQEAIVQQVIDAQNAPSYVVTEAMEVLDKVVSAQGDRTFTFAAITDMHYGSSDYIDGVIHACQGMRHISERIKLDAVAVLGDFTDEHQMDTESAVTDLEEMNALLDPLRSNVNLRVKGNHDNRPNAAAQTYRYIMAYSDATVWGSRIGGYFYRDFPEYKLRAICLNTTEVSRDNLSVSVEQYQWFADSLDLSAKEDAAEWGILVLSHHPLDWTVTDGNYRFGPILSAYQTGTSWTDGVVSCNYTDKNAAPIIANIHGHIHNLRTDKIYIGEPGNSAQTNVWRMATPASRVDFVNHYSGVWIEDTWYNKTENTANDTSFCVYCIDLDAHTIKAFCYGAGYDRSIEYSVGGIPAYTNQIPISTDTDGSVFNGTGWIDGYRVNSSGILTAATGYRSTGFIPLVNNDELRSNAGLVDLTDETGNSRIVFYDANKTKLGEQKLTRAQDEGWNALTIAEDGTLWYQHRESWQQAWAGTAFCRVCSKGIGANSILTVNEEITE